MQRKTSSPEETYAFGKAAAEKIKAGMLICLEGDLGAGKTLFARGLAEGLHVKEEVTSPTFAIMNVYRGDFTIYHFDLYRLESPEELSDIGFYEYAGQEDCVVVVEWPDKFAQEMPRHAVWIRIERGESDTQRLITIRSTGDEYRSFLKELDLSCPS